MIQGHQRSIMGQKLVFLQQLENKMSIRVGSNAIVIQYSTHFWVIFDLRLTCFFFFWLFKFSTPYSDLKGIFRSKISWLTSVRPSCAKSSEVKAVFVFLIQLRWSYIFVVLFFGISMLNNWPQGQKVKFFKMLILGEEKLCQYCYIW